MLSLHYQRFRFSLFVSCIFIRNLFLRHPAHALSCDPAFFKPLDPLVQVQLPHIEPYDHQVKYHFHCPHGRNSALHGSTSLTGGTHSLRYPTCGSSSPIRSQRLSVPALLPATSISLLSSLFPASFHGISLPAACVDSFQFQTLKYPIPRPSFFHVETISFSPSPRLKNPPAS